MKDDPPLVNVVRENKLLEMQKVEGTEVHDMKEKNGVHSDPELW